MIRKEKIESLKKNADLVSLIQSKGVSLKKNGKSYLGRCPFHEDENPSLSVNPETNLWQCFGCGKGGDAIRFVELIDEVSFPEAVKRLSGSGLEKAVKRLSSLPSATVSDLQPSASDASDRHPESGNRHPPLTVKDKKLLSKVIDYYRHTFTQDLRGLDYLKNERGITDHKAMEDFGAGFVNGTLPDILPDDEEVIKALKAIGILNAKGHETFYNCVTFPLCDPSGAVVNLYGRSVDEGSGVTHLYLPGPRSGLVNRQALKHSETIVLTESVIDALTLYGRGFKNVIPLYGVNGLTSDHLSLFNRPLKTAFIAFDSDEAGIKGAEALAKRLKEKDITPYIVTLPDKDVNDFFKTHTPDDFKALMRQADPHTRDLPETTKPRTLYKETDHGFMAGFSGRVYDVKGVQRSETSLKVTVKAFKSPDMDKITGREPFELSTMDLYSSRSRIWFSKLCAALFAVGEDVVKEDMNRLLPLAEDYRPKDMKKAFTESTKEDNEKAMAFLKSPDILGEILTDFETLGITGEETNKLVGYLAAVSRKLDEPLSVLIQSRSAAGKSTLQDAILSLVPEEDYVKYTRITDQALFYKDEESLVHKIIAIEEQDGMGGAAYSIRNIQSSKKITVAATGKDPSTGKMRTEEYTVKGPVAVMITTTAPEIEGETASRFLFLTIDESDAMTKAIHERQRLLETMDGLIGRKRQEGVIRKHHAAQRLLRPLAVVNLYGPYLSYPSRSLRTRRDHKKYLGLIRAIAYLHQYQREILTADADGKEFEYIEVTLSDIDKANRLADEALGLSLDELARPSRTLLEGICSMVKETSSKGGVPADRVYFTRRAVREHTGWSDWQVKTHIAQLEEFEYLSVRAGSKGKEYCYALSIEGGELRPRQYLDLTSVEEIRRRMEVDK